MTAEEVWGEPDAWRYVRGPVAVLKPERASDYTTPAMGFTETPLYTRTAMEAYAAEKVAEAIRALETQMEDQADDTTPSSIHRQNGKVWLEGWFDFPKALAANQHHGGNDADT